MIKIMYIRDINFDMLRKLRIKNFKGWKDTGMIDLAPVTVLFGSNSSGKSSIGQFLVMLKQTVRQKDSIIIEWTSGFSRFGFCNSCVL